MAFIFIQESDDPNTGVLINPNKVVEVRVGGSDAQRRACVTWERYDEQGQPEIATACVHGRERVHMIIKRLVAP